MMSLLIKRALPWAELLGAAALIGLIASLARTVVVG
jgi:hypothetical protein